VRLTHFPYASLLLGGPHPTLCDTVKDITSLVTADLHCNPFRGFPLSPYFALPFVWSRAESYQQGLPPGKPDASACNSWQPYARDHGRQAGIEDSESDVRSIVLVPMLVALESNRWVSQTVWTENSVCSCGGGCFGRDIRESLAKTILSFRCIAIRPLPRVSWGGSQTPRFRPVTVAIMWKTALARRLLLDRCGRVPPYHTCPFLPCARTHTRCSRAAQ